MVKIYINKFFIIKLCACNIKKKWIDYPLLIYNYKVHNVQKIILVMKIWSVEF